MANFVLALGVVMSVIGIAAIYFGYPIVTLERGWTSVIAGSTLLAGGVMTVAIGVATRAITSLKQSLAPRTIALADAPSEPHVRDYALPESAAVLTAAPAPSEAEWTSDPTPEPPLPEVATSPDPEMAPTKGWRAQPPQSVEEATEALLMRNAEDAARDANIPARESDEPSPPTRPASPVQPAMHELPEPEQNLADSPRMDDWLDREFADLDGHDHRPAQATEPEPPLPAIPDLERETVAAQQAVVEHSPPSPSPPATSAVIGRYESEGTSYVMYADGSIEAQSSAGVYRFSSMAELKAFIEG